MALGQGELRDGTGRWCRAAHPTVCGLGCHWAMDGAGAAAAHSHLIFSSVVTSSARIRLPMLSTWSGLGLGLGLGSGSVVSGKGQVRVRVDAFHGRLSYADTAALV